MLLGVSRAQAIDSTWIATGGGNWNVPGNWSAGVPNGVGDAARFLDAITAPATITQDIPTLPLGLIEFNSANAYTISGTESIAMQLEVAGNVAIEVNNSNGDGAHTVSVPIVLNHPLVVSQNSTGALTLSGAITGAFAVTKQGTGNLIFSGTTSNGINGLTVNSGAVTLSKTGVASAFGVGISTITIGDNAGGANADVLTLGGSSQFPTGIRIFITPSGLLDGGTNFNVVTGGVTMTGGMILNPRLRLTANTNSLAHTESAVISGGSIEFFGSVRSFNIADGAATDDMVLATRVSNGGLIKIGPGQLVLGGAEANDHAVGTTVNEGTLIASKPGAFGVGSLAVNNATARLSPGLATAVKVTGSLTTTGTGVLDVTDNDMVVEYTAGSPLTPIKTQITTGYAGGAWTGPGINSSTAAANPGFGIGYAEASAIFTVFPSSFNGVDVDNTAVLMSYTRYGDANLDKLVNLQDFNRLAANFGATDAVWSQGDFNYDTIVNLQDFNRLAANFGLSAGAEGTVDPEDWSALASVVPEPAWLSCGGVLAMLARSGRTRRQRKSR